MNFLLALNRMHVVAGGPLTTVQDLGRTGWAHLGVPRAGALDQPSARLANRLVGNEESAAVLETTGGQFACRFDRAVSVAVTGARVAVQVGPRQVGDAGGFTVPAGALLSIGVPSAGVRAYLAVAGGIAVPAVLGSRSHDVLSGTGPAPLVPGDKLRLGAPGAAPVDVEQTPHPTPVGGGVLRVRVLPGPQADWFDPPQAWAGAVRQVSSTSNRIGLRLQGAPIARRVDSSLREMTSEPMVWGAVQVPPGGEPVVFLADHPTTGGYPVIAVVHPEDLAALGQRAPGEDVQWVPIGAWPTT